MLVIVRRYVPGHFLANTLFRFLVFWPVIWFITGRFWLSILAASLMAIGSFTSDQTTHLKQPAHAEPAPTPIERVMQKHYRSSRLIGWIIEGLGVAIALSPMLP